MRRISLLIVCIVVAMAGCANTLWRYYEVVEEGNRWQVDEFEIAFHMEAYEIGNLEGHPLFRIRVEVMSVARYESEIQAAQAPIPWIDSVVLKFPDSEEPIVLQHDREVPQSIDDPPFVWKGRLHSSFHFEDIVLSEPPVSVGLEFQLIHVDRVTHKLLKIIPIRRELKLMRRKKFWIHT